ncbi:hypothetical protein HD553DRAFT_152935 [Filobasidium floriforme]|uniref:uncharacterized protein n=1 Tax=Filobasidium floriforme TaxID=5210 RepID=UPI001E8D0F77|nr:uncharacterized protein HD553DRAFT_152935 [Filobasidium floriforme]KAH8088998.1 hypothetical protein HD553DRAFT_152935 [Filobasidium floriforme]
MTSFPSSGSFIEQVRTSCRNVRQDAGIKISIEAIDKFLTQTLNESDFNRLKSHHGVSAFPLRFPTLVSEINFLAILSLLNTLSGYRLPLHKATGDGAYQNIIKILVGLFITGEDEKLTSRGLSELTPEEIAGILGVSLFSEKPHESLPGVTVGTKEGEVAEAVDLVVRACNETGRALVEAGYESLGDLVVEILDEAEKITESKGDAAGADHFIERLVTTIPGFADQTTLTLLDPPRPVYIYKKAFFLLFALYQRLDPRSPVATSTSTKGSDKSAQRTVPSAHALPMFIDNVLCTMLVHLEILDLSSCTVPTLSSWNTSANEFRVSVKGKTKEELDGIPKHVDGPRVMAQEAYTVRAAALDAGKVILERVREIEGREGFGWLGTVDEADIDGYLWAVAKDDPVLRKVPRMVERNTIMY